MRMAPTKSLLEFYIAPVERSVNTLVLWCPMVAQLPCN